MSHEDILQEAHRRLDEWLRSCTRRSKLSRNTIAIGIVALHHIRTASSLPMARETVVSTGGEIRLSRGNSLRQLLEQYGIGAGYLKEVTTRQGHQDGQRLLDALEWGGLFAGLSRLERETILDALIATLIEKARLQLQQEAVRLKIDQNLSPWIWMRQILEATRERSRGVVEQHLVGAKLEARFPQQNFPAQPAHAADAPTKRRGDFELKTASGDVVIHVTSHPTSALIEKCQENLRDRLLPIIITLREKEQSAVALAEDKGVADQIAVLPIDHFVAANLIELAAERNLSFIEVFREIIEAYNRRIEAAETDLSCKIRFE